MRLYEERDMLRRAVRNAADAIRQLRGSIHRKTASPYPDGSRSSMVNASSDVLPPLERIEGELLALFDCGATDDA